MSSAAPFMALPVEQENLAIFPSMTRGFEGFSGIYYPSIGLYSPMGNSDPKHFSFFGEAVKVWPCVIKSHIYTMRMMCVCVYICLWPQKFFYKI